MMVGGVFVIQRSICETATLAEARTLMEQHRELAQGSPSVHLRILDMDTLTVYPVFAGPNRLPPYVEYRRTDNKPPDFSKRGTSIYGTRSSDNVEDGDPSCLRRRNIA